MAMPSSRRFIIELYPGETLEISIKEDAIKAYSCQRLLQDVITKAKATYPTECKKFDEIVTLQTIVREFAVDHWLNHPNKSVSMIKDKKVLKPFYRQRIRDEGKISLDHFIIETKLGQGAFSTVYLVRKKDTGYLYALKQVSKANLSAKKKKMLMNERQAMLDVDSPFVSGLHYSFQTDSHCYFVMDFVPCGDLHRIAKSRKNREDEARFYVAETILALNAIHMENYIYRDLKPENLLLDLDGHIRLTDLGLSKQVSSLTDLNFSQCGTAQIMAPEILRGKGYDFMVDYYNLGTLAYELFAGKAPVLTSTDRMFIEGEDPEFGKMSDDLKDFIRSLLEIKPKERLGAERGLKEIISHPWLTGIDFNKLNQKKLSPPFGYDPNAIKYSQEAFAGVNIEILSAQHKSEDNYLPGFSFYGFGSSLVLLDEELIDPQSEMTIKSEKIDVNEREEVKLETYPDGDATTGEAESQKSLDKKPTKGFKLFQNFLRRWKATKKK